MEKRNKIKELENKLIQLEDKIENKIKEAENRIKEYIDILIKVIEQKTSNEINNAKGEIEKKLYTNGDINEIKQKIIEIKTKYEEKHEQTNQRIKMLLRWMYIIIGTMITQAIITLFFK